MSKVSKCPNCRSTRFQETNTDIRFIQIPTGNVCNLNGITSSTLVGDVKQMLRVKFGLSPHIFIRMYAHCVFEDDKPLGTYCLGCLLFIREICWSPQLEEWDDGFVSAVTLTGKIIRIDGCCSRTTILDIKTRIMQSNGYPLDAQRIIYAGRHLLDEYTLGGQGILPGTKVHLVLPQMRGC